MSGRILSIDPGDKRIGVAVSDPSGTIANPLCVLGHVARMIDAAAIAQLAIEQDVALIVVGQVMDGESEPGPQGRKAIRMAEAIRSLTDIPVVLFDEYGSTQKAQSARIGMGVKRTRRSGHMDELAATVILQAYLDDQFEKRNEKKHDK